MTSILLSLFIAGSAQAGAVDTDAIASSLGGTLHSYDEYTIEDDNGSDLLTAEIVFEITNGVYRVVLAKDQTCTTTLANGCVDGHPAMAASKIIVVPGGMERRFQSWGRDSLDPAAWSWDLEGKRLDTLTVVESGYQATSVTYDASGSVLGRRDLGVQLVPFVKRDVLFVRPYIYFGVGKDLNLTPWGTGHSVKACALPAAQDVDDAIALLESYQDSTSYFVATLDVEQELLRLEALAAEIDAWLQDCRTKADPNSPEQFDGGL